MPATESTIAHDENYSHFWYRLLEILPGFVVWAVLILPFILAVFQPVAVTTFVLIFDLYWLVKSLSFGVVTVLGYRKLNWVLGTDWQKQLDDLKPADIPQSSTPHITNWRKLYHAIILTTYKEDIEILQASIQSIIDAEYDAKQIILVLATEERDATHARQIGAELTRQYDHHFAKFIVTEHPDGIVGEVKAKGANATWAAKELVRQMHQDNTPLSFVMVSTADADTRFTPGYFARLTYLYVTTPNRLHCCYQPIPMFFNNIWDAPMVSRVLAFGSTFWQLIESIRAYRLITFSTHATSLQTLVEIDYWCTTIVNEDSRQYYRGYFHYDGNFRSVPMFIPIYLDAVHLGSFKKSVKNLYLQQQRWAYGVEHFPYIVMEGLRHPKIPALDRLALSWRAFEGNFSWATASYFITVVGWLPLLLNRHYHEKIISLSFQIFTRDILVLTWIGLFISAFLTIKMLPKAPPNKTKLNQLTMVLQWGLIPITAFMFGAIPAIDAQTRLMLGKYIGFRVTEKAITKQSVVGSP